MSSWRHGSPASSILEFSDPFQAKTMAAPGRNLVAEMFTIEGMMNQIAGAYRSLLSRG